MYDIARNQIIMLDLMQQQTSLRVFKCKIYNINILLCLEGEEMGRSMSNNYQLTVV